MAVINYVYCAVDEHGTIHEIWTSPTQSRPGYYFRTQEKGKTAVKKHNGLKHENLQLARFKMILDNEESEIEEITEHNIQETINTKANEKCATIIAGLKEEIKDPENILYKDFDFDTKKHFGVVRDDVIEAIIDKYMGMVQNG